MVSEAYLFFRNALTGKKLFPEAGRAINFYNNYLIISPHADMNEWLIKAPYVISLLENNVCYWYHISKSGQEFDDGLKKALNGKVLPKIKDRIRKMRSTLITKFKKTDFSKVSDKELADFASYYFDVYGQFVQLPAACRIVDRGIRRLMDENTIRIISVGNELTFALKESLELIKLAMLVKKSKITSEGVRKQLNKILQKYCYLTCGYFNEPPRTLADYDSMLKKLIEGNPGMEYASLKMRSKADLVERSKLLKTFNSKQKKIAALASEVALLKDYSKESYGEILYYSIRLFDEISQRTGKDSFFIKQLSPQEVVRLLLKKEKFGDTVLARAKNSITLGYMGRVETISGEEADLLKNEFFSIKTIAEQKGRIASKGYAKGPVSVVLSNLDFKKVKKGDILVVQNTNPDYLFIMRLASAIVAEDGGLTAHVSVTSRELGIPCIVGIENATKVLKDGDLVEVDANHAQVNILKRK